MDPSLPPEFKLQKLKSQLKEVRDAIRAERKTVKGLEKLVKVKFSKIILWSCLYIN